MAVSRPTSRIDGPQTISDLVSGTDGFSPFGGSTSVARAAGGGLRVTDTADPASLCAVSWPSAGAPMVVVAQQPADPFSYEMSAGAWNAVSVMHHAPSMEGNSLPVEPCVET